VTVSPERRRKLAAIADGHDEWIRAHQAHPMNPAASAERPDGSDYNQHDLDVHPPEGAEEHLHQIIARRLGEL
jgi:hypothetical protein